MDFFLICLKICGLALSVTGWGFLAVQLLESLWPKKVNYGQRLGIFELGIVGFAAVYIFAVAISLFAALGAVAGWVFCLAGLAGCAWLVWRVQLVRPAAHTICVWVTVLLFVTYAASHIQWNFDAGLYHLQAVSYYSQGPVPLGLANIHLRLGSNSAGFPLSALSGGALFGRDGVFLIGPAATMMFLGAFLIEALDAWKSGVWRASRAYAAASVALLLTSGVLFDRFALSPSSDLPSALSSIYAFLAFLAAVQDSNDGGKTEPRPGLDRALLLLVTSAVFAVVSKTSQIPVLLLALAAPFCLGIGRTNLRKYTSSVALSAAALGAWVVQGLMASGCVAFPASSTCLSVLPWAVEPSKAAFIASWIRSWARTPGVAISDVPAGFGWVSGWWDRIWHSRDLTALWVAAGLLLLACIFALAVRHRATREPEKTDRVPVKAFLAAFAVALTGLSFWFFNAPDLRFGVGFLIAAPSLVFGYFLSSALGRAGMDRARRAATPLLGALVLFAGVRACYQLTNDPGDRYSWRHEPKPATLSFVTSAGVTVRVPASGNQCWDAATPCTPEALTSLHRSSFLGHIAYSQSGNPADRLTASSRVTMGSLNPSRVGIFRSGFWQLDSSGTANWAPATSRGGWFGTKTGIPVVGDWNGSGTTKVGTWSDGFWQLDLSGSAQPDPTKILRGQLGLAGDTPVVGDWDGSGKTKVGVYRKGVWYLDTGGDIKWDSPKIVQLSFGLPGDVPVVGDWDGSGKTKIGIFRRGVWILNLSPVTQFKWTSSLQGSLGLSGDIPLVGDWDGSGKTKVGIYRKGTWFLDVSGAIGWNAATTLQISFGLTDDRPVIGDWTGTGRSGIGVFRSGLWLLNQSPVTLFDPALMAQGRFGLPSDVPLTGRW